MPLFDSVPATLRWNGRHDSRESAKTSIATRVPLGWSLRWMIHIAERFQAAIPHRFRERSAKWKFELKSGFDELLFRDPLCTMDTSMSLGLTIGWNVVP